VLEVIETDRPADELARRIRGLYPWPGCRVQICDAAGGELGRIRLVRARASDEDEGSRWSPGEIMTTGLVQSGGGSLEVVECQPEGKRPMPLADYRRGHRWHAGLRLVSVA
jgi:methionyl-tRNA formyltransferase